MSKSFRALIASVRFLASVLPLVFPEACWPRELFVAMLAFVRLFATMSVFMLHQIERLNTREITLVAFELLYTYTNQKLKNGKKKMN